MFRTASYGVKYLFVQREVNGEKPRALKATTIKPFIIVGERFSADWFNIYIKPKQSRLKPVPTIAKTPRS